MTTEQKPMDAHVRLLKTERRNEAARGREAERLRAEDPTNWKWTGICPDCGQRAVTTGRCLMCGWKGDI